MTSTYDDSITGGPSAGLPAGLDETLGRVGEVAARRQRLELEAVQLAAHVADLVPIDPVAAGVPEWAAPRVEQPGGPGTPEVAEMCVEEYAWAAGVRLDHARADIGLALVLRHRLPRLWDLVHKNPKVTVWRAQTVASYTLGLSAEAAREIDVTLEWMLGRTPTLGRAAILERCREAHYRVDPDAAEAAEDLALTRRGVWVDHTESTATTKLWAILDTPDAYNLDHTLETLAETYASLGDPGSEDHRRARALGQLAHPQQALDLLTGSQGTSTGSTSEAGISTSSTTEGCSSIEPVEITNGHSATAWVGPRLVVHLHLADLATHNIDGGVGGTGVGSIEGLGPATMRLLRDQLTHWLGQDHRARLSIRPVLHLPDDGGGGGPSGRGVPQHDPPGWMREALQLTHTTCAFPGCTRDSRACDADHIDPWTPDSNATRLGNLAPLCRRHHRFKTHHGWTYRRSRHPDDHTTTYTWRSPTGQVAVSHAVPRLRV